MSVSARLRTGPGPAAVGRSSLKEAVDSPARSASPSAPRIGGAVDARFGHDFGRIAVHAGCPQQLQRQVDPPEPDFWTNASRFFAEKEAGRGEGPLAQYLKQLMGEHVGMPPTSGPLVPPGVTDASTLAKTTPLVDPLAKTSPQLGISPAAESAPKIGISPAAESAPKIGTSPLAQTAIDPLGKTAIDPLAKTAVDPLAKTMPAAEGAAGASFLSKFLRYGAGGLGVVGGGYGVYEGAKEASEAKGAQDVVMPGLKMGAGGATALGGMGAILGIPALAELGPAGAVLASGIAGWQGGKAMAESDLFGKMIGAHAPGTTQTYTGSAIDQKLHPDQEATGPGSVSDSKTLAGPEGSAAWAEADKQLHPEKYSWYQKPWFGL